MDSLSKEAREARAAYARAWRRKNKDRAAAAQRRYWEKKAQQEREAGKEKEGDA